MAQRRFHYELAFEHYLRANAIPYVAVDEARRALQGRDLRITLKSFDFVVYSKAASNLLVDVKGRKHSGRSGKSLQNWVTQDDVECMSEWAKIFGAGFEPAFVFMFWCEAEPPDALFQEMFEFSGKWYAVLAVKLVDYVRDLRPRSARWGTVNIPSASFNQYTKPLKQML
ncbi:MAG: HYExAFE family protein [Phycisphaeraceae bacterium]|nr:HYExAFE family protein [Phycisphaeraceae bacterium]